MHSQKRGLLRPHSAGGSWLGGPLPIFVMLAMLIVGMYFFYSYNMQSNELELLRQKLDLLSRNHRKLQAEETASKAKIEQLNGEVSGAKNAVEVKDKECESELSKLRADVLQEKDNLKKVDDDVKDSQKTLSKLRDDLTECRANASALADYSMRQEETIQSLNQTIISSRSTAKQSEPGSAVDKTEDKPLGQAGVNRPIGNSGLQSDKSADNQPRETAVEEAKQAEQPDSVNRRTGNSGLQSDKLADNQPRETAVEEAKLAEKSSNVGVQPDSLNRRTGNSGLQSDKIADSQPRETAVEEAKLAEKSSNVGVQPDSVNRRTGNSGLQSDKIADNQPRETAVEEAKVAEKPSNVGVRPDSAALAGQVPEKLKDANDQSPVNVVLKANQTESKAKSTGDDVGDDHLEGKKPIALTTAASGIDDVSYRKFKNEPEKPASVAKSNASGGTAEDEKVDGIGRHRIPAEDAEHEVGRAPPGPDDAVVGDDERDNQVKPPKVDQKGADDLDGESLKTTMSSSKAAVDSADAPPKKTHDDKDKEEEEEGAVEFEDNEERINRAPVGRFNRGESS